jgi:transposase
LAKYRDKGCRASEVEIAQALTGSYREEHLFELKLAYEAWQFTLGQVEKVDGQVALQLGRMKCDRALPPLKPKARPKRRVNSPRFDVRTALYYVVGLDLTEIEGDQRVDGVDRDQRDRPRGVAVCDGEEVL